MDEFLTKLIPILPTQTHGITFIFEWLSPTNQIIIEHEEPQFILIGIINHPDYTLLPQDTLERIGTDLGLPIAKTYEFEDLKAVLNETETNTTIEGYCFYYGPNIVKWKTDWYNKLHNFKFHVNFNSLLPIFVDMDCPPREVFIRFLELEYDFECMQLAIPIVDRIYDVIYKMHSVEADINVMRVGLDNITGKDRAELLKETFGDDVGLAFGFYNAKTMYTETNLRKIDKRIKAKDLYREHIRM